MRELTTQRDYAAKFVHRTDALRAGRDFKALHPEDSTKASIKEHGSRYYVAIETPTLRGWLVRPNTP